MAFLLLKLQPSIQIRRRSQVGIDPADSVGNKLCAKCREDEARGPGKSPSSKLALERYGMGVTCEELHESCKGLVESGDEINLSLTANKHRSRTRKDSRGSWSSFVDRWVQERG